MLNRRLSGTLRHFYVYSPREASDRAKQTTAGTSSWGWAARLFQKLTILSFEGVPNSFVMCRVPRSASGFSPAEPCPFRMSVSKPAESQCESEGPSGMCNTLQFCTQHAVTSPSIRPWLRYQIDNITELSPLLVAHSS